MDEKKLSFFLIIVTLLFFACLVLLNLLFLSNRQLTAENQQGDKLTPITSSQPLTQKFTSGENGVYLIFIRLKNVSVLNKDNFIFNLLDENNNKIRDIQISGVNIGDDEWVKFQFEPILGSEEKTYNITLNSSTVEKERAILAYTNREDLVYKVYAKGSLMDSSPKIVNRFLNRFMADQYFAIVYLVVLTIPLIFLAIKFKKK